MVLGSWDRSPLLRPPVAAATLRLADLARQAALESYPLFLKSASTPPALLEAVSPVAGWRAAEHARRRVPAYRAYLAQHGFTDAPDLSPAERLARLPVTDKSDYVRAFSTEARCLDGRIPLKGTQIDESSGSSGIPYNWVRGAAELKDKHGEMSQFARYTCGKIEITINAFSMGAWATGVNVGEALRMNGLVKSTGPDLDKIFHTLRFFGPRYRYVITAYPPFLKRLLDEAEARGFHWSAYRIHGIVAGEGMSEGLRAYLERRFRTVWSGYGASDLDIGVAGELPLSVWIRKRAAADPALQRALFGDDPRLPMLFQYNPLDYFIETNAQSELIVTINRLALLSPRIRYNIHDAGGVIPFERMLALLRGFGLDPLREVQRPEQPVFHLPFLFLFGRSDSTISFMGANIYPEDVEHALFADASDARRLGAYCLELADVGEAEQRPCVHVEVVEGATDDADFSARLKQRVIERLVAANLDFRASLVEDSRAAEIQVRLHASGTGPFAVNDGRIKRKYILGSPPLSGPLPLARERGKDGTPSPSQGEGGQGAVGMQGPHGRVEGVVTVRPVTSREELTAWVRFPRLWVYPQASPWVPPLDDDVVRLLDRAANPFFRHGDATAFLAYGPDGLPVGRILTQVYHRHNERHGERTAFFGFFECLDDPEAARALVQAAARAGASRGCDTLRGPYNMTAMQAMGVLVDGFEHPPAIDQTYTPRHYPALLEGAGLRAIYPHTTYRIDDVCSVDVGSLLGERHRILTVERRLRVRSARMSHFDRELETLRLLLNESFAELSHFVPLTADELAFQVGAYRTFLDPTLLLVAEMDGVPRGFVLAVPDFNPLLKRLDGRTSPSALVRTLPSVAGWLWRRDACLIIQGVERRLQGQGIMRVLHQHLLRNLRRRRYRGLSVTWIEEGNRASAASIEALGGRPRHRLVLYEGSIGEIV